jgi:hypothetical protein
MMISRGEYHTLMLLHSRLITTSLKATLRFASPRFVAMRFATSLKISTITLGFVAIGFAISLKATTRFAKNLKVASLKVAIDVHWSFFSLAIVCWCF